MKTTTAQHDVLIRMDEGWQMIRSVTVGVHLRKDGQQSIPVNGEDFHALVVGGLIKCWKAKLPQKYNLTPAGHAAVADATRRGQ